MQKPLWAVYERADALGCVVCPLRCCADGTFEPRVRAGTPPIHPLPLSVHAGRAAALRAADLLRYDCAGTA